MSVMRLGEIQRELKAHKGQYNSYGKYFYRSCEDIVEAVKKLLRDDEALVLTDEIVQVGERYYVKAKAMLSVGKDTYAVHAYAREPLTKKGMDESQITGAASSYARKYALNGLLLIDDTKDADADETRDKPERTPSRERRLIDGPDPNDEEDDLPEGMAGPPPSEMMSDPQRKCIAAIATNVWSRDTYREGISSICAKYSYDPKNLSKREASDVIRELKILNGEDPDEN